MNFDQWFQKATSLWVRRLLQERKGLTLMWMERAKIFFSEGKSPRSYVKHEWKYYFSKRRSQEKLKSIIGR